MREYRNKVMKGLSRLWRSSRGATLPLIAFAMFPMMAALGASVDIGRIYITRSQLQAGVNAAALAAANAQDNSSETDENGRYMQAVRYFVDNVPNGYMGVTTPAGVTPYGGTTTLIKPTFTLSNGISRTDVTASGLIPMTFMSIFGIRTYRVDVTAHAEFQPHPLEVMVVLDNTGSMNDPIDGVSKMVSLKAAMHSFLNVLYQGAATQPDLALGIINYTITTNVGSILKSYGIQTQDMPGFTDRTWGGTAPDNLGWKGCVSNDETVTNMSTSMSVSEPEAYDIWPALPGEKPKPSSSHVMLPIKPYFYPPIFYPKSQTTTGANPVDKTDPTGLYYKPSSTTAGDYNGFLPTGTVTAETLYNLQIYKKYMYRMYKLLNTNADPNDDVIVATNKTSVYNITAPGAYNDLTGIGTDFYVRADRIPGITSTAVWKPATHYDITKYNVAQPTPNYQCPEPGLAITYGVPKTTFDNYVDTKVWPVYPANGTMHHIGFLWGWRLLTRYDVFTRTKPAGSGTPRRALVFMTDGLSALTIDSNNKDRVFTAYGAPAENQITTGTGSSAFLDAVKLRFTKACSIANSLNLPDSGKPPMIFTVAINKGTDVDTDAQNRLRNCGTSGFWLTTSPSELNNAFAQIARTLTDIHLVH